MLPILEEIKDKLVKALKDQKDVEDGTVLEIVSVLEKYPITRATLEETKIGKMVNDLRRKVKNEKLAKRVKQLVRTWKKILEETTPVNGGVPGPTHPAISQLRSSPAVSPALSRVSDGTLASPALGKVSPALGKHGTPKQAGKKSASPALTGYRPTTGGNHKALSPGLGTNGVPAAVQKVASPALSSGSSRVASPALARSASPKVSGKVLSPSVSRGEPKGVSGNMVSSVSGRASPALKGVVGYNKNKGNPLLAQSPVQSPKLASGLQKKQERSSAADRSRLLPSSNDSLSLSVDQRAFPAERLGGGVGNDGQDSDESASQSPKAGGSNSSHAPNHSIKTTLSLNANHKNHKDQRELSKTNVANRKRAREIIDSPQEENIKKSRVESPSLSSTSHKHKTVNGYSSKSGKKHAASLISSVSSVHSGQVLSPHLSRTANEDSLSLPHSHSDNFLLGHENADSNLSSQSLDRIPRDKHKVKTTEQLIEDLQKKNNGSKIGHTIMTKLRTNQIEQEQDVQGSALPAGMKPRGKRGRPRKSDIAPVPSSNIRLSQVKSEMVERFLNTSDPASPVDEYSPFKDDLSDQDQAAIGSKEALQVSESVYSRGNTNCTRVHGFLEPAEPREGSNKDAEPLSPVASTSQAERTGSALTLEEIYAQLPPINYDIDWDALDFFDVPEPAPVTEESIDDLHRERLPNINGQYDMNGDWTSWQQVMTRPSYEGSQLHILPYVDLHN